MDKYRKLGKIGRGTFGDVILAERLFDHKVTSSLTLPQKFAIKRVPVDRDGVRDINNEVAALFIFIWQSR
ncbi:MAG: hypothetical protein P4M11_02750 [Candidatus Pacebacteria bacterium]|nr:hypothetical protein [Candidatus Paceibacterota bacterium]